MTKAKNVVQLELWCPGCKRSHRFELQEEYLKAGGRQRQAELYCINSDAQWRASKTEREKIGKVLTNF